MNKMYKHGKAALGWLISVLIIVSMFSGMIPALAAEDDAATVQATGAADSENPNGDYYIYVPTTPGGPAIPFAFETPRTGIVNVEFDVTPLSDSIDGHIAFNTSKWTMAFSSDRKINIILRPNGTFAANDNTSTKSPEEPIKYVKGETYRVSVTIDIAEKKYSATVDGKVLAEDFAFRNTNPRDIDDIGTMGVVAASGSFKVTNISEKLVGLVDNDTAGMNETDNPAIVDGLRVFRVGPTHKFKKVQDVIAMLRPGDTVEVDGDATYPAPIFIDGQFDGTEKYPITFKGITVNGKKPLLKTYNALNLVEVDADNIVIDNFEIEGNLGEVLARFDQDYESIQTAPNSVRNAARNQISFRGVFHKADNLVVRNCVIHDCRNGILSSDQGSGDILVEYCEVYHNGVRNTEHNLYLATDEVRNPEAVARVQFNYIHDALAGNGLKTRAARNEVYYNWFENNYNQSLELIGPDPGLDGDTFWTASELQQISPAYGDHFVREDSDVVGNVIVHKRGSLVRVGGDGTSDTSVWDEDWTKVEKHGPSFGQTYGRYRFVNNTFVHFGEGEVSAVRVEFGVESVELYNNVFYKPNGRPMTVLDVNNNMDIINYVKWASGNRQIKGANNWVQFGARGVPGITEWTGTKRGVDPGFIDYEGLNFRLKSRSMLRGAGVSIDQTVAEWPEWKNTLIDWDTSVPVVPGEYTGKLVEVHSKDTSFPNPLMTLDYYPVNPETMKAVKRADGAAVNIGAF